MKRTNRKTKKSTTLLRQIAMNTSVGIGQQVPDTVVFPVLREKCYSVIMGANTTFTTSTVVPVFPTLNFTGGLFNDFAQYSTVFDKYRIRQVEVNFICVNPTNNGAGIFSTVIDYDDDAALTSINQAMDYKNNYMANTDTNFKRTLQPRAALAAYSGAFTSYAEARADQWFDCASPNIQYYGLKCVIMPTVPQTQYQLVIRAVLQFKNQH